MEFKTEKNPPKNVEHFHLKDLEIARKFASKMYKEFGTFIKGIILFGSSTKAPESLKKDIDILIILDDITVKFFRE